MMIRLKKEDFRVIFPDRRFFDENEYIDIDVDEIIWLDYIGSIVDEKITNLLNEGKC